MATSPGTIIVLRRGMSPSYYCFMGIAATANSMQVLVDRRLQERRVAIAPPVVAEARVAERRSIPPDTWAHEGVLLVAPSP
jgi:hypothetical protein